MPIVRVTAIVGIVAVLAVTAAGVWAASWSDGSSGPTPGAEAPDDDDSPAPPRPTPGATTPPPDDPEVPPVPPPPDPRPPADTTAPAPPVVGAPADGIATNDPRPTFSGTGEPGADVHVQVVDPGNGMASTIAAARVDASGAWSATTGASLPDGRHALLVMQVDAAGHVSDPVRRVIVVDTVILAPTIDAPPSGPLRLLPVLTGGGEPGALVTVRDDTGATIDAVEVDAGGRWSLALPDPRRDGVRLAASQADAAGNVSAASNPTAPLVFARPTVSLDATVPSDGGSTVVGFSVGGVAGAIVEVAVDGTPTGATLTLPGGTATGSTPPLADGTHTIAVRYREGSRVGSWSSVTVTIGSAPASPPPADPVPTADPTPAAGLSEPGT